MCDSSSLSLLDSSQSIKLVQREVCMLSAMKRPVLCLSFSGWSGDTAAVGNTSGCRAVWCGTLCLNGTGKGSSKRSSSSSSESRAVVLALFSFPSGLYFGSMFWEARHKGFKLKRIRIFIFPAGKADFYNFIHSCAHWNDIWICIHRADVAQEIFNLEEGK